MWWTKMSDIKFNNRYFLAKVQEKGIKLVLISIHYTILILNIKNFFVQKLDWIELKIEKLNQLYTSLIAPLLIHSSKIIKSLLRLWLFLLSYKH